MKWIYLIPIFTLVLLGHTANFGNTHERDYYSAVSDSSIDEDEVVALCMPNKNGQVDTLMRAWCLVPDNEVEILRQITIAVTLDMTTLAEEDCDFIIETTPDLSNWTEVASSAIEIGEGTTNPAGVCGGATIDTAGESCTRGLADGVIVPSGGAWRININDSDDVGADSCNSIVGLSFHVASHVQR